MDSAWADAGAGDLAGQATSPPTKPPGIQLACLVEVAQSVPLDIAEAIDRLRLPCGLRTCRSLAEARAGMAQKPPEVLLLDPSVLGRSGSVDAPPLQSDWSALPTIAHVAAADARAVLPSVLGWCRGCLIRPATPTVLQQVVDGVLAGRLTLCPRAYRLVLAGVLAEPGAWGLCGDRVADWLHERICAGDPAAGEAQAALFLRPLRRWLRTQFPHADEHLLQDGAEAAITHYLDRPERLDRKRGSLEVLLQVMAWRKVRAALREQDRRKRREWQALEGLRCQMPQPRTDESVTGQAEQYPDDGQAKGEQLGRFLAALPAKDRQVMELWLSGERRTEAFARVLGIEALPTDEQKRRVYLAKNRLLRAAQRSVRRRT